MHADDITTRTEIDYWRIRPSVAAVFAALFVTCGYGSQMDRAWLAGFLASAAGVLFGLFHLMHRRPRAAASWLLPWTGYILFMLPVGYPARSAVFDTGNAARFLIHRQQFEQESGSSDSSDSSGNHAIQSKSWRLGTQGADEIYLLYDATGDRVTAGRLLNKRGLCSTRSRPLNAHFQVMTISC